MYRRKRGKMEKMGIRKEGEGKEKNKGWEGPVLSYQAAREM